MFLLLSSSSDPAKAGVPRGGLLSLTVSVGGDGNKSEFGGELRVHLKVFFLISISMRLFVIKVNDYDN